MGAKVRGIRRAKANLDRIIKDVQGRKVVRAIQSAMLIGSAQAALTPRSIRRRSSTASSAKSWLTAPVTGRVGYPPTMRFMFTIRQ